MSAHRSSRSSVSSGMSSARTSMSDGPSNPFQMAEDGDVTSLMSFLDDQAHGAFDINAPDHTGSYLQ